jgi:hypothetical protein
VCNSNYDSPNRDPRVGAHGRYLASNDDST